MVFEISFLSIALEKFLTIEFIVIHQIEPFELRQDLTPLQGLQSMLY